MEIGVNYAFGTNPHQDVGYLRSVMQTIEGAGFASVWMPEHVVGFPAESYTSKYPYSPDGSVPWRGDLSLHDPLFVSAAAAQMTTTLRFGSGIVILPQRPPLLTAKELMTLDHLSGGRFEFGVGGGWSSEEYAVLGVPFEKRGQRFDEYIEAIRTAWRNQPASFEGEFIQYSDVVLMPRPLTPGGPAMLIGGGSPAALRRAATLGDGWFGHWAGNADPEVDIEALRAALESAGRSADEDFRIKASLVYVGKPEDLGGRIAEIAALGVRELVLIVPLRTKSFEGDVELWASAAGLGSD